MAFFMLPSFFTFAQTLQGSFFKTKITLKKGSAIGGYIERFAPDIDWKKKSFSFYEKSQGTLDENYARGLILKQQKELFLFLALDTVGVDRKFKKALFEKIKNLGFRSKNIIISANHTHSGPGGLTENFFWELLAMDRFQKDNFDRILFKIQTDIKVALSRLEKVSLKHMSFKTKGLQVNRRTNVNVDEQAHVIMVKSLKGKKKLGGIINYAIHGTALDAKNLEYSSDIPGAIVAKLENYFLTKKQKPIFLFTQGASGDIAPIENGISALTNISNKFLGQFLKNRFRFRTLKNTISVETHKLKLGRSFLNIKKCMNFNQQIDIGLQEKVGRNINLFLPKSSVLNTIKLGKLLILTIPGELTSSNGNILLKALKRSHKDTIIQGLSNDYLGYFTSTDEFNSGGYEACASFYKDFGAKSIIQTYKGHLL